MNSPQHRNLEEHLTALVNESKSLLDRFASLIEGVLAVSDVPPPGKGRFSPRKLWAAGRGSVKAHRYQAAFVLVFLSIGALVAGTYLARSPVGSTGHGISQPLSRQQCKGRKPVFPAGAVQAAFVKVNAASGAAAALNIYIDRHGNQGLGRTAPLAIEAGSLCPGAVLTMTSTELVRSDGQALPVSQVASWAVVDQNGTHVTVWVSITLGRSRPSDAGAYSGSVLLSSAQAQGANVPVDVHVEYQKLNLALAFSLLAAFGGFTWAWLLHTTGGGKQANPNDYFWRYLALCVAVLLVAAAPVVNVQVLSKPNWQGSLTQYIGLATLVGAAAIAATPTLRALVLPSEPAKRDA